jgi:hypothetical protein
MAIDSKPFGIRFECAMCHKSYTAYPPDFEGFMHEFHKHIENDNAHVYPVCVMCFALILKPYERKTNDP